MAFAVLSEDLILVIFLLSQRTHAPVGGLQPRIVLSHVSKQWRYLSLGSTALWSDILITRKTKIHALRIFLDRAGNHVLDINILHLPTPRRIVPTMRNALSLLSSRAHHWAHLCVIANATTLHEIMPSILNLSLPQLQSFEMTQIKPKSVLHFGPFKFNPESLQILRLRAVTIHLSNPAHLAGLHTLDVEATSCQCMLDQMCLDNLGDATIQLSHPPKMLCLRQLSVMAVIIQFPTFPSLDPTSIVSLKLGGFRGSSPASIPEFVELFKRMASRNLRELELDAVKGFAWDAFILALQTRSPIYHHLESLCFRSLTLGILDMNFAHAFPMLSRISLFKVDPQPLHDLLRVNPNLWSTLLISIDTDE
ncbi:hypothetical protein DXG01_013000 [Tephrocybe rancida]|nr:hypothetical protein DXG01_013000 [Tephrocybe rancida]